MIEIPPRMTSTLSKPISPERLNLWIVLIMRFASALISEPIFISKESENSPFIVFHSDRIFS